MAETLLSLGLDIGTTTTQMILTKLTIENSASSFSVPDMQIAQREVIYKSPVHFTPLVGQDLVDGDRIRQLIEQEFRIAGIRREDVDTGAIIITGETSRKENARAVINALSLFAGDFVVATAGPHLESVLAAKGSGAALYSKDSGKTVLHMDIGGGTTNLALIQDGKIVATGCLNIGGRLLKFDAEGRIIYRSPVLEHWGQFRLGDIPETNQVEEICNSMARVLEMAAGLHPVGDLFHSFWTAEAGNPWLPADNVEEISFSGGVGDCIESQFPPLSFGDIGPTLGKAIKNSLLCQMPYRLGTEVIRATVIGAGSYATQLSGSTVFYQNIQFPLKNLPVVDNIQSLSQLDGPGILALTGCTSASYNQITQLADEILAKWPHSPIYIALQSDIAKALGHALALRTNSDRSILCIDRINIGPSSYLDVGHPVQSALPVIIKTLILAQ